ncbi:MAG: ABC transporter permease [Bacteroidota bacterium]
MLKNYLTIALRTLWKQRGFSAINVVGLALGLAGVLVIGRYVQHELSYDRHFAQADQTYRIAWHSDNPQTRTPHPMALALAEAFPEVETATTLSPIWGPGLSRPTFEVHRGDIRFEEGGFFSADSTFFEVFDLPFVAGDVHAALRVPGGVVITETVARRYFGDTDPVGETITVTFRDDVDLTVTGVVADVPEATHFDFQFLLSYVSLKPFDDGAYYTWADFGHYNYLVLDPDADADALEARLGDWSRTYIDYSDATWAAMEAGQMGFRLQPITDIHLHSDLRWELEPGGSPAQVALFVTVAVFLLLLAGVNFVNLSTAQALQRVREVGVRKALGARRGQLVGQYLGESVLLSSLGLVGALGLVATARPYLEGFTGVGLGWADLGVLLPAALVLTVAVGVLAGAYPALYLTAFDPARVLKRGGSDGRQSARIRRALVAVQFGLAIALLIGTAVVSDQLSFLRDRDLGLDAEQVVVVRVPPALRDDYDALADVFARQPGVLSVTGTSNAPGGTFNQNPIQRPGSDQMHDIAEVYVGHGFAEALGIEVEAGRAFQRGFGADSAQAVLLNAAAARMLGEGDAASVVGAEMLWHTEDDAPPEAVRVVGVVEDFHFQSLHRTVDPLLLRLAPGWAAYALVRVAPADLPTTMARLEASWAQFAGDAPFQASFLDADFDALYGAEVRMRETFALFTTLALVVAALGLFGLAAFTTRQRTKELGVRRVLGASVPSLVSLVLRDVLVLVGVAFVVAAPVGTLAMQRWLDAFPYRTDIGAEPFLLALGLAFGLAIVTVGSHALRAATTNTVTALRDE